MVVEERTKKKVGTGVKKDKKKDKKENKKAKTLDPPKQKVTIRFSYRVEITGVDKSAIPHKLRPKSADPQLQYILNQISIHKIISPK